MLQKAKPTQGPNEPFDMAAEFIVKVLFKSSSQTQQVTYIKSDPVSSVGFREDLYKIICLHEFTPDPRPPYYSSNLRLWSISLVYITYLSIISITSLKQLF